MKKFIVPAVLLALAPTVAMAVTLPYPHNLQCAVMGGTHRHVIACRKLGASHWHTVFSDKKGIRLPIGNLRSSLRGNYLYFEEYGTAGSNTQQINTTTLKRTSFYIGGNLDCVISGGRFKDDLIFTENWPYAMLKPMEKAHPFRFNHRITRSGTFVTDYKNGVQDVFTTLVSSSGKTIGNINQGAHTPADCSTFGENN